MGKMKDLVISIMELYESGMGVGSIAEILVVPLDVVEHVVAEYSEAV
jgi:orotate phosphoribosyltransferase-like protein